ncbi:MAG: hypothetical protein ACLQQB_09405 [Solirubrobacteraceae bacterium]|jgi:hypothetical protein
MATVSKDTRTPGSILASQRFDAAIEDGIAERPARYPNGAAFVGADLPGLGEILARNAREQRAVVLVYPDGEEWIIEPHKPVSVPKAA